MPTMQAITYLQHGGPEVLSYTALPIPTPKPDELLIQVKACGINRADLLQRQGKYSPPAGESEVLGLEIAGIVAACGADVTDFKVGDRVFGLVGSGAYAEYCLIPQKLAMPIPNPLSFTQAAAIPEAFMTAQEALFTLGDLCAKEKVLIHAGGSGVGSAAIQLAKLAGALVLSTVGSDHKKAAVLQLGAETVFNYRESPFAEEILQRYEGVNLIIDFIGAKYLAIHLDLLNNAGRLVCVGLMGGTEATLNLAKVLQKRLQIKGLIMRSRSFADKCAITERFKKHYLPLFESGRLHAVLDRVFSFKEVATAHAYLEERKQVGKVVLEI